MSVTRLIWIVLLTGGIASAHQEGPLAGRGNWGLGVALPSESGSSFSVWKIRSPTNALGLEVGVSLELRRLDRRRRRPRLRANHTAFPAAAAESHIQAVPAT